MRRFHHQMSQFNIYEYLKLKAFNGLLNETDEFFYRKICRWYSKTFCTPLHQVYKLPWDDVLLTYYEDSLDEMGYNRTYDMAIEEYVPEIIEQMEKEDEEFHRQVQEQVNKRRKEQSLKNKSVNSKPLIPEFEEVNIDFDKDLEKEILEDP